MATSKFSEEELLRMIRQKVGGIWEEAFFNGIAGKPFGGLFDEYNHTDLKAETKFYHWSKQDRYGSEAPDENDIFCATPEGRIIVGEICGTGDGAEYSRFLAARSLNANPVERDYGEATRSYPEVWIDSANMRIGLKLRSKGLDDGILHDENGKRVWFNQGEDARDIQQKFDTVEACFDNLYCYGDIDAE